MKKPRKRNSRSPIRCRVALLVVGLLLLGTATAAMAQIAGFKISDPIVDSPTATGADATFDVLAYGSTASPGSAYLAGTVLDAISNTVFTQSYDFGNGLRPYQVALYVSSLWNTYGTAALRYGDGQQLQMIALALDPMTVEEARDAEGMPPNRFRGTFTHSYDNGTYTIDARLTPQGGYGNASPGVNALTMPSTGMAQIGMLTNTFNYGINIQPLSPPGTGTYTYGNTIVQTNFFPTTVLSVHNSAGVEIQGIAPSISASGSCPGMVTITVSNVTPGDRVSMWNSDAAGMYVIPQGGCAGTVIDLDTTAPLWKRVADGSGAISYMRTLQAGKCDVLLQALDQTTCLKSPVVDVATLIGMETIGLER